MPIGFSRRFYFILFFFRKRILLVQRIREIPVDPARLQSVFRTSVFLRNVRRITGRFPATPEDDRSGSSRKNSPKKKAAGKTATAGFRLGEGKVGDGCSRNPELFLRVDTRCATKGLIL